MSPQITIKRILLTLWFWSGVILSTALTGTIFLLFMVMQFLHFIFFPLNPTMLDRHDIITMLIENVMASIIYEWMVIPGFWKVETYNPIDIDMGKIRRGRYILASNHTSIIDTLFIALFSIRKTYTYNLKWAWVPLFGQLCLIAGYVGISQQNKSTVVERVAQKVMNGYSVMIYPEGTRSKDPDVLQPLKTGAFRIALMSDTEILPITFRGTSKAVDRYGMVDCAEIMVVFGRPFSVDKDEGGIERAMQTFRDRTEQNMRSLDQVSSLKYDSKKNE